MQLVDKLILLNRFLRYNKLHEIDYTQDINNHQKHWTDQSKSFKDKNLYKEIDTILESIKSLNNQYSDVIKKVDSQIEQLIRQDENTIIARDYTMFSKLKPDLELQQTRESHLAPDFIREISIDIGNYSDWKYPGLELNPSTGKLTREMLACDPLYIYTGHVIDKDSVKNQFNNFFSEKRLLMYDDLNDLPQEQFGTITNVLTYNFWPLDPIKDQLQKVIKLLRPGGYYIFTYNDCEYEPQIDFCNNFASYNTFTMMSGLVEMYGFDIIDSRCMNDTHSWMIVRRPGELQSIKSSGVFVQEGK